MMRLQLLALAVATLCASSVTHAQGNPAEGRRLVYTCHGCHGIPGYNNAYPNYPVPKIAGQNQQYLVNALQEYKKGERTHPTMMGQAQSLSDQDIQDVATYLAGLGK